MTGKNDEDNSDDGDESDRGSIGGMFGIDPSVFAGLAGMSEDLERMASPLAGMDDVELTREQELIEERLDIQNELIVDLTTELREHKKATEELDSTMNTYAKWSRGLTIVLVMLSGVLAVLTALSVAAEFNVI